MSGDYPNSCLFRSLESDMYTLKQLNDQMIELVDAYDDSDTFVPASLVNIDIDFDSDTEFDSIDDLLRTTNTMFMAPAETASDNLSTTLLMEHPVEIEMSTQFARDQFYPKKTCKCCVVM